MYETPNRQIYSSGKTLGNDKNEGALHMKAKLFDRKFKRIFALALVGMMIVTALAINTGRAVAARNDVIYTLDQPNNYMLIEKGKNCQIETGGAYDCESGDRSKATVTLQQNGFWRVDGLEAGAVTVAVGSSLGVTAVLNYQVFDPNKIGAYVVKDGGEVYFSEAGKTKQSPVVVKSGKNDIQWHSSNPLVATVNANGAITSQKKGTCIVWGSFTDKWGVPRDITLLAGVGIQLGDSDLSELIELINKAEAIISQQPNPYTDNSLDTLDDAKDKGKAVVDKEDPTDQEIKTAIDDLKDALANLVPKDGSGGNPGQDIKWVEDPAGSNIWKPVNPDGSLNEDKAIWGGPDGKPGGGDDERVTKFDDGYWVHMGQNVWRKVRPDKPLGPLGPLTGGGPDRNPSTEPVTTIKDKTPTDNNYYVGPLGPDKNGDYYYGDPPRNADGWLDSDELRTYGDDIKYYLINGVMVPETEWPGGGTTDPLEKYKPVGEPDTVFEVLDDNGNSKVPPEYVYNPDKDPGNGKDRPAIPDDIGGFWVEDPDGSNIWKHVDNDGSLSETNVIWGGPDGKFGGGDDKPVTKFDDGYWVDMGQNVWCKVERPLVLGPFTGGGPDKNPATGNGRPVYKDKVTGQFFIGPMSSKDGDYYYGDPYDNSNGLLDSTGDKLEGDDVIYYRNPDGTMTTKNPSTVKRVDVIPQIASVMQGAATSFTAIAIRNDNTYDTTGVTWSLVGNAEQGTKIDKNGSLTIAAKEPASINPLVIKATSIKTPTMFGLAYAFVVTDPTAVEKVEITPSTVSVVKGSSQAFTAKVTMLNGSTTMGEVKWSIEGNTSPDTKIDRDSGLLIVGDNEKSEKITVKATANANNEIYATATVNVKRKPITETDKDSVVDDGHILKGSVIGDNSDWLEIARNGEYSLILRLDYLRLCYDGRKWDDPSYQFTTYGQNGNYLSGNDGDSLNKVRSAINAWFQGTTLGDAEFLKPNAKLRDYTRANTAAESKFYLGTGSDIGSVNTGFSKPKDEPSRTGYDTAFALSYGEAANFISKMYSYDSGTHEDHVSGHPAITNYNVFKFPVIPNVKNRAYMWLRSPGSSGENDRASVLGEDMGRVYKNFVTAAYGYVYPALWVQQDIFDLK
jgi:hypothetical protein